MISCQPCLVREGKGMPLAGINYSKTANVEIMGGMRVNYYLTVSVEK